MQGKLHILCEATLFTVSKYTVQNKTAGKPAAVMLHFIPVQEQLCLQD